MRFPPSFSPRRLVPVLATVLALIGTAASGRQLLVRRSLAPGERGEPELAFFLCWSPRPVPLAELAAVAGARWAVEDCFAEAKNENIRPAAVDNRPNRA